MNRNMVYGSDFSNVTGRSLTEMVRNVNKTNRTTSVNPEMVSPENSANQTVPQKVGNGALIKNRMLSQESPISSSVVDSDQTVLPYTRECERLQFKMYENQMDTVHALDKKEALYRQQIEHEAESEFFKMQLKEKAEEHRRGQYEDIVFASDGTIQCKTMGTITETKIRYIVNIKFPKLFILKSTSGESGYYELDFEIGRKPKRIYLDANKCDSGKYLLKKLVKAGVVFKCNKKATQIDYVEKIWAALLNYEPERITIAAHTGWVKIGEHQYRFVEEDELVWNQVIEFAL
ncbi:MAG: hypothetical protein LIP12_15260 [Clostridiales bacterium]|nr:hypothetical protein [Clostridiales bacterium]